MLLVSALYSRTYEECNTISKETLCGLGCMLVRVDKTLVMRLDEKFAGKPCVVDKGCEYFDEIVTKGIE